MKTCTALVVCIFSLGFGAMAQNPTDELLDASKATEFIQLRPDFDQKMFFYSIDRDVKNKQQKSLDDKLILSVPTRDKKITFAINCYNPFKYVISISDTMMIDPSFKAIEDFVKIIKTAVNELPSLDQEKSKGIDLLEKSTAEEFKSKTSDSPKLISVKNEEKPKNYEQEVLKDAKDKTNKAIRVKSEKLIEWKYLLSREIDCLNPLSLVIKKVYDVDSFFYQKQFVDSIKFAISQVNNSKEETLSLLLSLQKYDRIVANLENFNKKSREELDGFKKILESEPDITNRTGKCKFFAAYSLNVLERFINECEVVQKRREEIVHAMQSLSAGMNTVLKSADMRMGEEVNTFQNTFILKRFTVSGSKMQDVTLAIRKRDVVFKDEQIQINESTDVVVGEIRIRTHQTLIPEFSTGFYYTNVKYPIFGTQILGDSLTITEGREKLPVVAAGMLNLTLNAFSGLTHPVFQLGVGTGKGRPSLLAGVGVRLRWEKPIVISGGAIWSWKKTLTNYAVGKFVPSTTALEEDLKFTLDGTPNLYIGVQINF